MKEVKVHYFPLKFKQPRKTSREVLTEKKSWFITEKTKSNVFVGECSIIESLSPEYQTQKQYEEDLNNFVESYSNDSLDKEKLRKYPSILFAFEQIELQKKGFVSNEFLNGEKGVLINGLVWMAQFLEMEKEVKSLLERGFKCIKIKIGQHNFEDEINFIRKIRKENPEIILRVDANGAFYPNEALDKLQKLSKLKIHSIEQPIKQGMTKEMSWLCKNSALPIALDEELIGINDLKEKEELLNKIKPKYLVLKPSLHGGLKGTKEWINLAKKHGIGYWLTSALESNIGLEAISNFAFQEELELHQGLGTGSLYSNNIPSGLEIIGEKIFFNPQKANDGIRPLPF